MKHIDEYYKDWCGESHLINSGHPVHDSSEAIDFAEFYANQKLVEFSNWINENKTYYIPNSWIEQFNLSQNEKDKGDI